MVNCEYYCMAHGCATRKKAVLDLKRVKTFEPLLQVSRHYKRKKMKVYQQWRKHNPPRATKVAKATTLLCIFCIFFLCHVLHKSEASSYGSKHTQKQRHHQHPHQHHR